MCMIADQDDRQPYRYVPLLIKIQQLAHLVRRSGLNVKRLPEFDFLSFFVQETFKVTEPDLYKMLCQAIACRRLVLILDGLDEVLT